MSTVVFTELSTNPTPPSVSQLKLFAKTDDNLYVENSAGVVTQITEVSAITSLSGDVSAVVTSGNANVTVNTVGGATAANIASATTAYMTATSSDTPNTLVKRDGSGNFSSNIVSLNALSLLGSTSGTLTISVPTTFTSYALTLPTSAGLSGQSLTTDGTGILSWQSTLTTSLPNGQIFVGNPSNVATPQTPSGDLSMNNTGVFTLDTVNTNVGTFGSSTSIPTFTVNGKGLITAASSNAITAPAGTLTGTTLASNVVNSSLTSVGTITSGTWNGTTIAIANGGTGQTTASTAFAALSPLTTAGDIIYENNSLIPSRLGIGSTGQLLTVVAGLPAWVSPATSGTVTSVGLADGSTTPIYSISGSPVTSSGTLTFTLNTEPANSVFAGPTSGGSAQPTFRALVSADIPAINLATSGNGGVTGILPNTNTTATSLNTPGTLVLRDGSGNFSAGTITASLNGNATNITATTNSTLTTLTALALPTSQLTGNISLTTQVSGVLPIANGGTNSNTASGAFNNLSPMTTTGDLIYESAPNTASRLPIGTTGEILTVVSGIPTWATPATNGTVTSVALSLPSIFTVTGSPVTTSGTLTGTLNVEPANTVFAGPVSGASAIPTFRLLVSADIPNNAANTTGTASNITATSNSTLTTLSSLSLPGSQVTGNISGNAANITATTNTTLTSLPNLTSATSLTIVGSQVTGFTQGSVIFAGASGQLTQDNPNFYWNDSTLNLGLGTIPATNIALDIVNTTGTSKAIQTTSYGVGSSIPFRGRFARGTLGTPAAVQSGDNLSVLSGRGYGTSQFAAASTGAINIVAGETFTNTSNATYLQFEATPTGSVTLAEHMRVAATGVTLGPQSLSIDIHQINGGVNLTTKTITSATYTVDTTTTDEVIFTDSTSNAITITLPTATNGRILIIQDKTGQAATNHITVTPPGSVLINGVNASILMGVNYGGWEFISDGTNWMSRRLSQLPSVQAISASNIDWATVGVAGGLFTKTLSANTTFTFSNATPGQCIVIRLTNTASNYTVTWPSMKWPVQTAPVMTTGVFSDVYTIIYDGTNYYGSYVQNF